MIKWKKDMRPGRRLVIWDNDDSNSTISKASKTEMRYQV